MEFTGPDHKIVFDPATATVTFAGELRLSGVPAYEPLKLLLIEAENATEGELTLDLRQLQFLNSAGITILSMFLFALKKQTRIGLLVLGSKQIPWQEKSLKNFQRIWDGVKLEIL